MALHIDKDRTNCIDDILEDIVVNYFEITKKVYESTLGSQLISITPTVMKVDYSSST